MGRLVAGSEAAEDVRDVDHAGGLQAAHQGIEQVAQAGPGRLGQVGVDRRGRDVLMTEQNLDDAGIDAVLQQPGGIAVAQGMGVGRRGSSSPAVRAAAAKVLTRTPVLSGAVPALLGNSQRGWRWWRQVRRRSFNTGSGSGTRRSLSPLPITRNTP